MTPQHMQQLDRFHEGLLTSRLDAIDRESWGLIAMELDLPALESGTVAIRRFAGVLPDGALIAIDETGGDQPHARPVEGHFEPHQAALEVFVGLPRIQEARNNLAESKGELTRYFRSNEVMYDRYGDGAPEEVELARPNLRLLFGDEPREDFSTIKVAEVRRSGAGQLVPSSDYIAPCINLTASPALSASFEKLLTGMNARRGALIEGVRHRGSAIAEFSAADVTRYLLLSTINAHIPVLKHFATAGDVSPKAAYLMLCQLAGQLSTFAADFDPNDIPKFVYQDLRFTFGTLVGVIQRLLQATLEERYVSIPLTATGNGLHVGEIVDERVLHCRQFLIGVQSSVPDAEVADKLPRLAKLASPGDIDSLLAAAVSGVELKAILKPPPQIPTRAGVTYFTVGMDGSYWQNIVLERKLNMYLPAPFTPGETQIQLLGILG